MADEQETVTLAPHQWNVVMDVLRLDIEDQNAPERLGDVARQAQEVLDELMRQLGRDGIERH
ncbi:MAG TPA: hypothetical protein VFB34_13965 [Chloroflexota bacterium]|nr:hypothetical protein [Chloroflexota bacterium]